MSPNRHRTGKAKPTRDTIGGEHRSHDHFEDSSAGEIWERLFHGSFIVQNDAFDNATSDSHSRLRLFAPLCVKFF
jgi:hypothetical protein